MVLSLGGKEYTKREREESYRSATSAGVGELGETPDAQLSAPSSVSTSHPYFWAPFILVGDGK